MKPKQLSRATLQRKIRALKARQLSDDQYFNTVCDWFWCLSAELRRTRSLLQAYKDRETDKAHRIIRSNP